MPHLCRWRGPRAVPVPLPSPTGSWGTFGEAQKGAPWLTFLQSPWLRTRLRAEVDGETWGHTGPWVAVRELGTLRGHADSLLEKRHLDREAEFEGLPGGPWGEVG